MYATKDDDDLGNETISDSSDHEGDQARNTSKEEKQIYDLGRWTSNEHFFFLEALVKYGNEWKQIQEHIKTRSSAQARSHAQKYFIRLKKEFKGLTDVNVIKQRIHNKFQYELQEHFKPKNINTFLDIMIKLIYIHESNIANYNSVSFQKKRLKIKKIDSKCLLEKGIKFTNKTISKGMKKRDNDKNIFKIERNLKRKDTIDVDAKNIILTTKNRVKCHISKKRIAKEKEKTIANPSCINYFTFNMYDNSFNNFLNPNLKHIQSNSSIAMPMNQVSNNSIEDIGAQVSFGLEAKEASNPFYIQFDHEEGTKNDIENNINPDINLNDFYPF